MGHEGLMGSSLLYILFTRILTELFFRILVDFLDGNGACGLALPLTSHYYLSKLNSDLVKNPVKQ